MISDNLVVNCGLLRGVLERNRQTLVTNLKRIDTELDNRPLATDIYSKTQTDDLLDLKANSLDVYSKTETDTLLDNKMNSADIYTKQQIDDIFITKNQSQEDIGTSENLATQYLEANYYDKGVTDQKLNLKADKSTTYTKAEMD